MSNFLILVRSLTSHFFYPYLLVTKQHSYFNCEHMLPISLKSVLLAHWQWTHNKAISHMAWSIFPVDLSQQSSVMRLKQQIWGQLCGASVWVSFWWSYWICPARNNGSSFFIQSSTQNSGKKKRISLSADSTESDEKKGWSGCNRSLRRSLSAPAGFRGDGCV